MSFNLPIVKAPAIAVIVNGITFYVGWFICIQSGADGYKYFGLLFSLCVLIAHLIIFSTSPLKETKLVAAVIFLGLIIDSLFINFDILRVSTPNPISDRLTPLWIIGGYIIFGTTINHCLTWLSDRKFLSCIFGAIGGLASYYAGVRLGAADFGPRPILSAIVIFVVWGILFPSIYVINNALDSNNQKLQNN
ncbi:MAG: DUF2878 domain-containing protein [Chlamydiota bacterium]|nr:DUF2878 domain-containing protein [Chlamydiota bacterium]